MGGIVVMAYSNYKCVAIFHFVTLRAYFELLDLP
jgi:hypothetical protein